MDELFKLLPPFGSFFGRPKHETPIALALYDEESKISFFITEGEFVYEYMATTDGDEGYTGWLFAGAMIGRKNGYWCSEAKFCMNTLGAINPKVIAFKGNLGDVLKSVDREMVVVRRIKQEPWSGSGLTLNHIVSGYSECKTYLACPVCTNPYIRVIGCVESEPNVAYPLDQDEGAAAKYKVAGVLLRCVLGHQFEINVRGACTGRANLFTRVLRARSAEEEVDLETHLEGNQTRVIDAGPSIN